MGSHHPTIHRPTHSTDCQTDLAKHTVAEDCSFLVGHPLDSYQMHRKEQRIRCPYLFDPASHQARRAEHHSVFFLVLESASASASASGLVEKEAHFHQLRGKRVDFQY